MIQLAIECLLRTSLENHVYNFNGEIRLQSSGGAIGDSLTGAIAAVYMINWCREFKQKLSDININPEILKVYIDDETIFTKSTPPGAKYINNQLIIDEDQLILDRDVPADIRTARVFQSIANSICDFLQVTVDSPSQHESGFMPVLDIAVKVENNKILYKFYKKPIASKKVILANSALPFNVKKASLTEGAIRRLRYTDRSLPWSVVTEILSEYSNEMRLSGYEHSFRAEVIQAGIKGFRRQAARSDAGGVPLFRERSYERQARRKKKLMAKVAWYRPANVVGFMPVSPGGELASGLQKIVTEEASKIGMNIRVTEQSGTQISALLTTPNLSGCMLVY